MTAGISCESIFKRNIILTTVTVYYFFNVNKASFNLSFQHIPYLHNMYIWNEYTLYIYTYTFLDGIIWKDEIIREKNKAQIVLCIL